MLGLALECRGCHSRGDNPFSCDCGNDTVIVTFCFDCGFQAYSNSPTVIDMIMQTHPTHCPKCKAAAAGKGTV